MAGNHLIYSSRDRPRYDRCDRTDKLADYSFGPPAHTSQDEFSERNSLFVSNFGRDSFFNNEPQRHRISDSTTRITLSP